MSSIGHSHASTKNSLHHDDVDRPATPPSPAPSLPSLRLSFTPLFDDSPTGQISSSNSLWDTAPAPESTLSNIFKHASVNAISSSNGTSSLHHSNSLRSIAGEPLHKNGINIYKRDNLDTSSSATPSSSTTAAAAALALATASSSSASMSSRHPVPAPRPSLSGTRSPGTVLFIVVVFFALTGT